MIVDPAAVLRSSGYPRTPWRNGGGETMELAIWPGASNLDTFAWRISMATVASDGPFSLFAGVDRTLCILDGAGMHLQIGDQPERALVVTSEPFVFSGDAPARSRLIGGPVTDFNVMTRRSRFRHTVTRIELRDGDRRDLPAGVHVGAPVTAYLVTMTPV